MRMLLAGILLAVCLGCGWVGAVEPPGNAQVLLTGTDGDKSQPTAWVRTPKGDSRGRLFYTAQGLPEDFQEPNYRRLLVNAIFWVAGRSPPERQEDKR